MAVLQLRQAHAKGLNDLWRLNDTQVVNLVSALAAADLVWRASELAEKIAPKVADVPPATIDGVVDALTGLSSVITSVDDLPMEVFVEDVAAALSDAAPPHSLTLTTDERQKFKTRLTSLLDIQTIRVAAKARTVFIEHEHYLCYARIMTDIRPVFDIDVADDPMAAMIVHTLKLAYHEGDDVKEFFVALDPSSLERLSELIERARAKQASLERLLHKADLHYITPE
jgi:hypothetical protein